jgi:hypothetical protein
VSAGFARCLAYLTSLGCFTVVVAPFQPNKYRPDQPYGHLATSSLASACRAALVWGQQQQQQQQQQGVDGGVVHVWLNPRTPTAGRAG